MYCPHLAPSSPQVVLLCLAAFLQTAAWNQVKIVSIVIIFVIIIVFVISIVVIIIVAIIIIAEGERNAQPRRKNRRRTEGVP